MFKHDNEERFTTQLSADSDLTAELEAGKVYAIEALLHFSCGPGGFKVGFESTAQLASNLAPLTGLVMDMVTNTSAPRQMSHTGQTWIEVIGSDYYSVLVKGTIKCEQAGAWSVCWAQTVAEETPTVIQRGSNLLLTEI